MQPFFCSRGGQTELCVSIRGRSGGSEAAFLHVVDQPHADAVCVLVCLCEFIVCALSSLGLPTPSTLKKTERLKQNLQLSGCVIISDDHSGRIRRQPSTDGVQNRNEPHPPPPPQMQTHIGKVDCGCWRLGERALRQMMRKVGQRSRSSQAWVRRSILDSVLSCKRPFWRKLQTQRHTSSLTSLRNYSILIDFTGKCLSRLCFF